nr:HIRAN domain-containing protein [Staphylococcus sp. GDY8P198P]
MAYEAYEKYANISLADSVEEREIDVPYNSSDDEDIVRFIRKQPKGTPKKIYSLCNVVGVSYRQEEALKAVVGDNLSLRAEKEPTNPYDSNAIKIIADYEENDEKKSVKIGYIPREKAEELVKYNNINVTLRTIYLPDAIAVMYPSKDSSGNVGFRIDIWIESQKQKNKKKVFEEQPYDSSIKMPDNFASRNAKAKELEEEGYLDNAIEMYLENTSEDDTSLYPFKRLAIIYRKRKDFENEILIINKALDMFEKRNYEHDKKKKEEMELRLKRVKELKEKEELKKKD